MFFSDLHTNKELAANGDFKAALRCAKYYKEQGNMPKMSHYILLANQNMLSSNISCNEKVNKVIKIMKVLWDVKETPTNIARRPEC